MQQDKRVHSRLQECCGTAWALQQHEQQVPAMFAWLQGSLHLSKRRPVSLIQLAAICVLCRLLECWAAHPVPLQTSQVHAALEVLDESLRSHAPEIQAAAVATLGPFSHAYLAPLPARVRSVAVQLTLSGCVLNASLHSHIFEMQAAALAPSCTPAWHLCLPWCRACRVYALCDKQPDRCTMSHTSSGAQETEAMVRSYVEGVSQVAGPPPTRRGCAAALGVLPRQLLLPRAKLVLDALAQGMQVSSDPLHLAR